MKLVHRGAKIVLALATACFLALAGAMPSSAALSPAATWTLQDFNQRDCFKKHTGDIESWFAIPVSGSTSVPITAELHNLPPGSTSGTGTVHPGELEDGGGEFIGQVGVTIAPAPEGEYTAELSASDGTETQTVPVKITIDAECV